MTNITSDVDDISNVTNINHDIDVSPNSQNAGHTMCSKTAELLPVMRMNVHDESQDV